MKVYVNGRAMDLEPGISLESLVRSMDLNENHLVIEHNGEPMRYRDARTLALREGDRLELVRPVAGG